MLPVFIFIPANSLLPFASSRNGVFTPGVFFGIGVQN
jgi:hypothetical protein